MLKPLTLNRINSLLLFVTLLTIIFYYGREVFIVVIFASFLAMLMAPVANKLEKFRVPRVLSTILSVLIIVIVLTGIVLLFTLQIMSFVEDLPKIQSRLEEQISSIQGWVENQFGMSNKQQAAAIKAQAKNSISSVGGYLTGMVTGTATIIGSLLLVLVFTFLFLLQREKYGKFFSLLYRGEKKGDVDKVIENIGKVAQQYLTGRLISISILAVMYMIGFSIVGIQNAILLSLIAAVFTFIPYVGPFIGGLIPFLMAIVSEDSFSPALGVLMILGISQTIDNYFIEPYVVGGSLNLNPLFTILILIVGGVLWGIAGVILFLPLLGVVKIIFENVEGLKPYAYLVGDQKESSASNHIWEKVKNIFKKGKT